jgi:hypothetical protein
LLIDPTDEGRDDGPRFVAPGAAHGGSDDEVGATLRSPEETAQ